MALSKIQAESVNLADDYAFTGTVTGAGEITASTNVPAEGGTGTVNVVQGLAKAWVRYRQVSTVGITDSFSVSSVTDHSAGLFTITKSGAMNNADYAVTATAASPYTNNRPFIIGPASSDGTWTTTQVEMATTYHENTMADAPRNCVAFYGDLA